jgi:kumamolisin
VHFSFRPFSVPLASLLASLLLASFFVPGPLLSVASAQARAARRAVGDTPPLVLQSRVIGSDEQDRPLTMSIGLALRNQDQLSLLLNELYDSASPLYHHFLSVEQFTAAFGPNAAEQQAVVDYLTQQGFSVTQTYPNHLLVDFSGPEWLAEQAFGVAIDDYQSPSGRQFYANVNSPTLPVSIAGFVTSLTGLDDANTFAHPPILAQQAPTLSPQAGNCPAASQTAYIPSQLSTAYNYDGLHKAGFQGQGQTVGLFELDGYSASDVQAYTQCFGGSSVPISNVIVDGFNGQPDAGAVEVELDMEVILSQAPRLAKLLVYEAPNTTQGYNDEFARIVSDRTPVVSVSWGQCETAAGQQEAQQENTFFQEAAAQGQSILVAAGDSGSETCFEQNYDPTLNADDPASQPYVTGVGGTTLTLNSNNSYASEHVWNSGFFGGAGGGGLSQFWKQPTWQTGPGTNGLYANGMRETPDVSLDADPATGYPIYCTAGSSCSSTGGIGVGSGGGWLTVGGTSAAAPMWAAMIALANQQAAKAGKGHLGFLNPLLYKIGSSANYHRDFHDIIPPGDSTTPSNNDELGINGGAYPVTVGYDMATGWGSFNAASLAADLVALIK